MHVQTGKVSKGMEIKRIFEMVQVKNTVTEMKDCFNGLITALDMTSERKKNIIEYAGTVGQYQKA